MHPTKLPTDVVSRVMSRRGRLHIFDELDPAKTALIIIDMQNTFCAPGAAIEVPEAREIVPNVNRLASAMRSARGTVVWVQMTIPRKEDWPIFLDGVVSPSQAVKVLEGLQPGSEGHRLWHEMDVKETDLIITKNRFSAFLPSASSLPELLQSRGIDAVVIAGTLSNVCCESSARDAMMLNFKTTMVSDANAGRSDDEHLAALVTFVQSFGDVKSTDEVVASLKTDTPNRNTAA